jgi:serine/threonine protein phosphatase PrpC
LKGCGRRSAQSIADLLVTTANEAGGLDNISVIVVRIGHSSGSGSGVPTKTGLEEMRRLVAKAAHKVRSFIAADTRIDA